MIKHLSMLATALTFCGQLHAAVIQGVTATESSAFANRGASNLVNGSGLFGDSHTASAPGNMWVSASGTVVSNQFVTFDLGTVRTVKSMKIWNYNEGGASARGIQVADISTAGEDAVFTTNFPNVHLERSPGVFTNDSHIIDLGNVSARFFRISVISNFLATENYVGLSEVQFIDDTVPPTVLSATRNFGNDQVSVRFSETVQASTATNTANYSVFSGTNVAAISSVTLDEFSQMVVLHTSTLDSNLSYTVTAQNVHDSDGIISITNSSLPIAPELVLWLKADEGVLADGNGLVNEWDDQSGIGNNALQSDPGIQPTLVMNAVNGKPVLHFNGAPNYLDIPHSPTLALIRDVTIYAVVRMDDTTNYNGILGKTVGNQPGAFDFYLTHNSGKPSFFRGNGASSSLLDGTVNPTPGVDPTNYYIVSATVSGTNGATYLNGSFNGNDNMTAGVHDGETLVRVGSRADLVTKLKGDLAEIILIRGTLSATERGAMDTTLGNKYGIHVISLEFTEQPAPAQKLEGQTATFNVVVAANSPDITYQWQKNTTNIVGATNATYTTPILTLADNNNGYRVIASIPESGLTITSDTATLTVLPDQEKPTVISAGRAVWDTSKLVVVFSESVDPATATSLANYSVAGVTLVSATVGNAPNKIVFDTTGFVVGNAYSLSVLNVQDLFSNTIDAAVIDIGIAPAGVRLWLKADAGVTADAGFVSGWSDFSGNANDAFQPGDQSNMPTLITNDFNGQPGLRFDGAANYLVCAPTPSLGVSGDMTIYAVASFVDFEDYREIVGKSTINKPAPFDFYLFKGTGLPRLYRGDGNANLQQVTGTGAPTLGVPHVVTVSQNETTVNHFLDGVANGSGTLDTIIADDPSAPLGIGTRSDFFTRMKGDIAEIMIFDSALSDNDRAAIDAYLGAKYGVNIGAPENIPLSATHTGNTITLTWPTPVGTFILESTINLGDGWTPVLETVTSSDGVSSVTLPSDGAQKFYQLHKQ